MGLDDIVKRNFDRFNENDLHIWSFISANRTLSSQCTIEELAKKCNVSRTTILRFAKKLDFQGFSELKIYLKIEAETGYKKTIDVMLNVCNDYRRLIDDMEKNDCTPACAMIQSAGKIYVYGTGAVQSAVAKELSRMFLFANKHMYHIAAGEVEKNKMIDLASPEDLVILISFSGESESIINTAQKLKLKNIPFISITKFENNTLARLSNYNLYVCTSNISTLTVSNFDTTAIFFIMAEMLLLKYFIYLEKSENRFKKE